MKTGNSREKVELLSLKSHSFLSPIHGLFLLPHPNWLGQLGQENCPLLPHVNHLFAHGITPYPLIHLTKISIHSQGVICHSWAPLELMFDSFCLGHVTPLEPPIKCQVSRTPLRASKNVKFRLSRNSTKFDVVARFYETIPTVKPVSSSEI